MVIEPWNEWFARWAADNDVLTIEYVRAIKNTDHYCVARRMFAKGASDRVLGMQLDAAKNSAVIIEEM